MKGAICVRRMDTEQNRGRERWWPLSIAQDLVEQPDLKLGKQQIYSTANAAQKQAAPLTRNWSSEIYLIACWKTLPSWMEHTNT